MPFRITALDPAPFAPLFAVPDEMLVRRRARRVVADASPGYPCRVSLTDAAIGETLLLINYEHQPADTPYRAGHAIYVRCGAARAVPQPGEVPAMLATRLLSIRGFDAEGLMRAAEVSEGDGLALALDAMVADRAIACVHLHTARQGCYLARADRV